MQRSALICSFAALALIIAPLFVTTSAAANRSSWRRAPEGTLAVTQFAMARRVVERRPDALVDGQPVEADGGRVYAFVQLFNKSPATTVTMVWRRDGRVVHRYQLHVGRSPSWHTWSYVRATQANCGRWTLSVLDASGTSLEDHELLIQR
jgi:Protein of unknown function (DUF2914)